MIEGLEEFLCWLSRLLVFARIVKLLWLLIDGAERFRLCGQGLGSLREEFNEGMEEKSPMKHRTVGLLRKNLK